MDSEQLVSGHAFGHWLEVGNYIISRSVSVPGFTPPGNPVVYAMRLVRDSQPVLLSRMHGQSDLLRVGMSCNFGLLQGERLFNYRTNHQKPNARVRHGTAHVYDYMHCQVEIGWTLLESRESARQLEADILERYFEDHFELPPWNRSG